MMCQREGCINEASELYMDRETLINIQLCLKHYNQITEND